MIIHLPKAISNIAYSGQFDLFDFKMSIYMSKYNKMNLETDQENRKLRLDNK